MYPLLALTIENSSIFFFLGAIALIVVIVTGITTWVGKAIAVGAVVCLGAAFLMKGGLPAPNPVPPYNPYPNPPAPIPNPQPTPNPYNPYPNPTPSPTNFGAGVIDAFKADNGSVDDAIVLSAMFDQLATSLEWDGIQQSPRIVTANDLGISFGRLQQYRFAQNPTPIAQKFPRFETFVAAEMARTGLNAGPLDSSKRNNAVIMFRTVASSLRTIQ